MVTKKDTDKTTANITPWDVSGTVDYKKLVKQFGTVEIDDKLMNQLSNKPHFMLKRKIFFSHRDLNTLLEKYKKGKDFFLYTGRGPSERMHIGHLIPMIFTKWLQDTFDVDLYLQLSDDEKYLFKRDLDLDLTSKYAYENTLDLIAVGFKPKKTFIFKNTEFSAILYKDALKVSRLLTLSTAKAVFGFKNDSNIGQIFYPAMQIAPCMITDTLHNKKKQCLVPLGIDQDPYFRLARDVVEKLGYDKPAVIHSKFLPSLSGESKMSSSVGDAIYTTDDEKTVNKKVSQAKTGGKDTLEEQRKFGGVPEQCKVFDYYYFLFEEDDELLNKRRQDCKSGDLLCGTCKKELANRVNVFLAKHQAKRKEAEKIVDKFIISDKTILCNNK